MADEQQQTTVSCSFYDPAQSVVVALETKVDTTLGARMVAVREAAAKAARAKGWKWFCIPATDKPDTRWLVFRMEGTMADYRGDYPSRDAAEMLVQHRGQN